MQRDNRSYEQRPNQGHSKFGKGNGPNVKDQQKFDNVKKDLERICNKSGEELSILMIAEKPSIAKNIAWSLSGHRQNYQ